MHISRFNAGNSHIVNEEPTAPGRTATSTRKNVNGTAY